VLYSYLYCFQVSFFAFPASIGQWLWFRGDGLETGAKCSPLALAPGTTALCAVVCDSNAFLSCASFYIRASASNPKDVQITSKKSGAFLPGIVQAINTSSDIIDGHANRLSLKHCLVL